jgi:hypothetical protein
MSIEERKRPLKQFEVVKAYGPYQKGARIQPTGHYRSQLLALGVIREVQDEQAPPAARQAAGLQNRMLDLRGDESVAPAVANRGRGRGR